MFKSDREIKIVRFKFREIKKVNNLRKIKNIFDLFYSLVI